MKSEQLIIVSEKPIEKNWKKSATKKNNKYFKDLEGKSTFCDNTIYEKLNTDDMTYMKFLYI